MGGIFKYTKGDKVIWSIVFILSITSILAVYSSIVTLAYKYKQGDTEHYLIKHVVVVMMGLGLMYLTHKIKYTYYSRLSQILLVIAIPLLAFTLISGTNLNEASRWLSVPGTGLTFQTSDLAKLALIMYLARLLSQKQDQIKDFKTAFLPIMAPVLIVCGLILPANFSTAAVLFSTCMVLMFIGRVNLKYLASMVGIGLVFLTIFIAVLMNSENQGRLGTWKKRIENFQNGDSESNYQSEQAKIAIATGGIIGKGPGKSTQRNFLPHPYSDFIYAIIIEEYGLIGGLSILALYVFLLFRGVMIALKSTKPFGAFLAFGCAFSLVFQGMINMAVAVNLFPVTGQPLPMLSMGGTSIGFTCIAIGIILSVSRESEKDHQETPEVIKGNKISNKIQGEYATA